jgi:hypothetical protein
MAFLKRELNLRSIWLIKASPHQTEKIVRQDRKFQGAVSNGISGCVRKRGGSKMGTRYQLPAKRRSNEVLRRRLGSRCLRQGLNVRFFPFGVVSQIILDPSKARAPEKAYLDHQEKQIGQACNDLNQVYQKNSRDSPKPDQCGRRWSQRK